MIRIVTCCLLVMAGCNEAPEKSDVLDPQTDTSTVAPVQVQSEQCYALTTGGNNVVLSLQINGSQAAGELDYAISGKDKNTGTFTGLMSGDTLTADYTFNSEGVRSVRQVKYLVNDSVAVEGYGKVEEHGGRMEFAPGAVIDFGHGIVLSRANCKK